MVATGCSTPKPELDWDVHSGPVKARVAVKPKPRPQQYAYAEPKRCPCDVTPVPQSRPAWYQQQRPSNPPAQADANFLWPVKGRVITDFGSRQGGERNDGINIEAAAGTPIYAAGDGTVSYSGNELRNYGNLMLVRHDNGYVTAYAHADYFVVNKGDRVTRGQMIGIVGQTGDVSRPQLHFELRKGSRGETPVNPLPYLSPTRVATR
ncbi:murein DD-endopeptidase MepM/ murein hydrolase activator NlpD [Rhizomicrobium palustre]|uniref:Murein DD-endopeptidase MepM/ murein hydrolase activator NlpD n=1 Tax=Rhizomicrobium palustre TaxID=189966 RepID=A0A846MTY8_9PROT|nr:M23 family metallopeptidase [Rhizomicrobium palustre]NIK86968.1 murein DD-endopeptidase MepM/ murein hydrolase activator NlpD [Rhizomicrobium palustre]